MNKVQKFSYTENILKEENIRIFTFRNRYLLINPVDVAFMMFEREQTFTMNAMTCSVKLIEKGFAFPLSSFPQAKKTAYPNIPMEEFKFICDCYAKEVVIPRTSIPFIEKAKNIQIKYRVSFDMAKYLAKLPEHVDLESLYSDILRAHSRLGMRQQLCPKLLNGSKEERKAILIELLPKKAYRTLGVDTKGWRYLHALCEEIAKGYTYHKPITT